MRETQNNSPLLPMLPDNRDNPIILKENHPAFELFTTALSSAIVIFDLKFEKPVFVSKNINSILGYLPEELSESTFLKIYPDIRIHASVTHIMSDFFNKYSERINDLFFTYTCPLIHKDGTSAWYLHELNIINSQINDYQNLVMSSITNFDICKNNNSISMSVKIRECKNDSFQTIFKEQIIKNTDQSLLNNRETEILKLMSTGCSSREIADKLFLSHHSVYKYRKSMLKKLNAKNAGEVIKKSLSYGYLP